MDSRVKEIRENEKNSHIEIYSKETLYHTESWLKKPIKTVEDIIPLLCDIKKVQALDLGCGVGRNSIYIAKEFKDKECKVDCIDILDMAIEKLNEYATQYGIEKSINGIVNSIEDFKIIKNKYDFILAVSSLEHVENEAKFFKKLEEIRDGVRDNGIVCLIINSEIKEWNRETYEELEPQFEINLQTDILKSYIEDVYKGWDTLKNCVVKQEYDIPRGGIVSHLSTNVITYVGKNR
ncbi:class I SAM-dependent methyltransferase [Pseudobutyrivibrio xylanivorans]|uniref:Methyltransferase domain-containing protein n=1 Tax=Pseudobutyrivibrio xylanivorans DSM 14809 TaxID=1123012 RepID=A0A1M6K6E8_PSEXY|nr:class I SAM-dependent methyltransferase [Pseudobutyrivibrio xylanivorans]SHJ54505.1 Methyltransferase domain-containing protein [Pseudobutyrivibrio xylanivorans DSM 14809]